MNHLAFLYLLLFVFSDPSIELTLIGSVHKGSEHYSEGVLLDAIKKIKPDVILTEGEDSMFDSKGKVKQGLNFLEANVYVTLQRNHQLPIINISMSNRNEKMVNLNYSQTLNEGFSTVQSRFNQGKLHAYDKFEKILSTFSDRNACLDNSSLSEMNSDFCFKAMKDNYQAIFSEMADVLNAEPDLGALHKNWSDIVSFHELRDTSMAENALKVINKTKKKRYLMVVGLMHMPAVYEKLRALSGEKIHVKMIKN